MKLKPISDYIIVEPRKEEQKTKSGIVLPDTVEKEKPQEGVVVAAGPGRMQDNGKRAAMQVKAGDKVLFSKYGPMEVKVDGKEYFVIKEEDILAIIK
ncbi:co-chaperone GroES [Candidatus Azambacteria bacterium RIFCSPHIGHO2_02_FULL_52_12]|uniref:Co-chaperonin GroES n=1 Tax=Candidatus Azambacteria bacterium RIFCSPLOWO2_01_FULL_46_25 TaxID=1797298 RepID=A0A1F5BTF5_9BACT|nr:MAG: co-chaperone GroES [Candidatus Azambacteria bacterium RIFCSPHIGHO2_02_FULL_52_12]OGD33872.1 MAG: co-chaperone GroES [Candidatus Azambacteria bacterium RIFCSPLOWO2_01_FULL_46_25]OGD36801.1 MAG: co-chaperone GroES [Candidatus Azambacteria bacterium RIFCSPHIGHO2_01_FULL_51_74]